jgi:Siphovirus Gp157.
MNTLYNLTTEYQNVLYYALENDEIDNETFEHIQKLDEAIEQKIENIIYVIKELDNNISIINKEIERLTKRANSYYKNLKSLKTYCS